MVHSQSHTLKMGLMVALVLIYFLVELVVGHILNSITLIADSFHMLSDFIALIIGIAARRIGKWPKSSKNTFGWQRAEVVGTLVNTVMLTTLTFTIFIKSIQRFIEPEEIKNPVLLLGVGAGGLLVNIIGLIILRNHHGHSHGGAENTSLLKDAEIDVINDKDVNENETDPTTRTAGDVKILMNDQVDDLQTQLANHDNGHGHSHGGANRKSAGHMNMRAVFLHVLADFFGSIAVVISALILWLVHKDRSQDPPKWLLMIDPMISLIMVVLILISTIPLLKKSGLILLQSVPKEVSIQELKDRMEEIDEIDKIHDLHVWLLQSDVIIGTVHIRCSKDKYVIASRKVKNLFHDFRIHCTTIQAEFDEHVDDSNSNHSEPRACVLDCNTESKGNDACNAKASCCPTKTTGNNTVTSSNSNKTVIEPAPLLHHQASAPCILLGETSSNPQVHHHDNDNDHHIQLKV